MKPNNIEELIEYGLDKIDSQRTVEVNLRDLMYIHQTLQELNSFFHQPQHYTNLESLNHFLGNRSSGGAYQAISKSLYGILSEILPSDIDDALDDAVIFEHPDKPYYH